MSTYQTYPLPWLLGLLLLIGIVACNKEEVGTPPSIDYVRVVAQDSSISEALPRATIAIIGQSLASVQTVYINDLEAYFNPTLVTSTSIILSIPQEAPWRDVPNTIRVETRFGSAETAFTITQPTPLITGFSPVAASAGSIVTITGEVFDNLIEVRFDEVVAEVVSASSTEIQVKVPDGIGNAYIFVETPGGVARSAGAFGFALLLYGDAFPEGFWEGHWGGNADVSNTEVFRGSQSMKYEYLDAWGGFQIGANSPLNLSDYSALKVSIYGGPGTAGKSVAIVMSDLWGNSYVAPLQEGSWIDLTIPLSDLGDPAELSTFIIQSQDFVIGSAIYIDDLGFI